MTESIASIVVNSPYIGISSLIIGIIIAIVGIWISFFIRRIKSPVYSVVSYNLIINYVPKLSDVSIKYKDQDIRNLSVSRIAFWNRGKDTINKSDIIDVDPLKITITSGQKLLDATIIYEKNKTNLFKILKIADDHILFTFDYLDFNDSAIFQILHTGRKGDIKIEGTIKGAGKPQQILIRAKLLAYSYIPLIGTIKYSQRYIGYLILGLIGFLFCYSVWVTIITPDGWKIYWILILLSGFLLFFIYKVSYPHIPKELEIIEEID
jgi:hypothetical protein